MREERYSSRPDTNEHIKNVQKAISIIVSKLVNRGMKHDKTKMEDPELPYFDKYTPLLKKLKYGTDEYQASLDELQVALKHHYAHNSHHPEHYGENGIYGMNIIDIMEMFCDWWAASKRTKDGSLKKSIEFGAGRFKMSSQLKQIFENSIDLLDQSEISIEEVDFSLGITDADDAFTDHDNVFKCPNCKSTKVEKKEKRDDNGIMGPGYNSWVTDSWYSCKECGIRFDVGKKAH